MGQPARYGLTLLLALSMSLGVTCASYARPRNGQRSLVVSVAHVTDPGRYDIGRNACNSPTMSGVRPAPPCMRSSASTIGHDLQFRAHSPATAIVSTLVAVSDDERSPAQTAVTLRLVFDGRPLGKASITLAGGERLQAPLQAVLPVHRGVHTLGLAVEASYSTLGPGDVTIGPVSMIATLVPRSSLVRAR